MEWLREQWSMRPFWMNLMLLFCAWMAFIYVPWDLFWKPVAIDEEVWFGIRFHGVWAKVLAVPHWIVYALGTWGFLGMKKWMVPWATVYMAQMTIAMVVWPLLYVAPERGLPLALANAVVAGAVFGWITFTLWGARARFASQSPAA